MYKAPFPADTSSLRVVTRMDTPKSGIRSETGTEKNNFSANHSDSSRPCWVQRDKYTKTEKGQDANGYCKVWIKAYIEVSCFSRSFCKNLVRGANNVCLITVPRLPCKDSKLSVWIAQNKVDTSE